MPVAKNSGETTARHRPKALTVFAAAFVAGAAAAVGVNRLLDVHIARSKPQIECEPIFVALRSLPQGAPVTVWDVALRDWPKAMLPGSALRAHDSFEGLLLRHPLREGQPLLAVQLMPAEAAAGSRSGTSASEAFVPPVPAAAATTPAAQTDLWTPAESISQTARVPAPAPALQPAAVVATDIPVSSPAVPREHADPTAEPAAASTTDVAAAHTDLDTPPVPNEPETAVEPQPADPVASEPVAGAEPVASATEQDVAATPTPAETDSEPDAAAEAGATGETAATDIDAPQPTDPATLPSVVTSKDESQAAAAPEQTRDQPRRYLVVPERIALQADTSFSAPPAAATPSPAAVPPVQAPGTPRTQQPVARQPTARAAATNRNGQPPAASRQQAQPSRVQQPQPNRGQQVQPNRSQPAKAPQRPRAATTPPQRTWGRAFPNMAAGIDAIGQQWQQLRSGEDDTVASGGSATAGNDRRR